MSYSSLFKKATRIFRSYLNISDDNDYKKNYQKNNENRNTKNNSEFNYSKNKESNNNSSNNTKNEQYYYELLGLKYGASISDIKDAYKKLISQYHPDKVANLGPELQLLAQKKTKDINEAYQYFKKKLNFN